MDMFQKYPTIGDNPQPRFGHTFTKISSQKVFSAKKGSFIRRGDRRGW